MTATGAAFYFDLDPLPATCPARLAADAAAAARVWAAAVRQAAADARYEHRTADEARVWLATDGSALLLRLGARDAARLAERAGTGDRAAAAELHELLAPRSRGAAAGDDADPPPAQSSS